MKGVLRDPIRINRFINKPVHYLHKHGILIFGTAFTSGRCWRSLWRWRREREAERNLRHQSNSYTRLVLKIKNKKLCCYSMFNWLEDMSNSHVAFTLQMNPNQIGNQMLKEGLVRQIREWRRYCLIRDISFYSINHVTNESFCCIITYSFVTCIILECSIILQPNSNIRAILMPYL